MVTEDERFSQGAALSSDDPPPTRRESSLPATFRRIAWARGGGSAALAEALSGGTAIRIEGDHAAACVEHRIDLLVTTRYAGFDLVPTVVPYDVDLVRTTGVTAAIGPGPHSPLAAAVAAELGAALGVTAELATVYAEEDRAHARARLDDLRARFPNLDARLVAGDHVRKLVDELDSGVLLVVGAAGGGWLQRQLFGAGHRLLVSAPRGAIVAKMAPRRCFQVATEAHSSAVGPHLRIGDARRLVALPAVPVAEGGKLVGVLRKTSLLTGHPGLPVEAVMDEAVAVLATAPLDEIDDLSRFLDGAPVPVIGPDGRLIGLAASGASRQIE